MDLLHNPFCILNASVRDDRQRLYALAHERALSPDCAECETAVSALTNPRRRLTAEIAWLPGVEPERIETLIARLKASELKPEDVTALPPLASVNVIASALSIGVVRDTDTQVHWIASMACALDRVEPEDAQQSINLDRSQAGFVEVTDRTAIEEELDARRQYCRSVLGRWMNGLLPDDRRNLVSKLILQATQNDRCAVPLLLCDLVDAYEVLEQTSLKEVLVHVGAVAERIRQNISLGYSDDSLCRPVEELCAALQQWRHIALPMLLCKNSLGSIYEPGHRLARIIDTATMGLHEGYRRVELAIQLTERMADVFAADYQLSGRVADDLDYLCRYLRPRQLLAEIRRVCAKGKANIELAGRYAWMSADLLMASLKPLMLRLEEVSPDQQVVLQARQSVAQYLNECAILLSRYRETRQKAAEWFQLALEYAESDDMQLSIRQSRMDTLNQPWTLRIAARMFWQRVLAIDYYSIFASVFMYAVFIVLLMLVASWGNHNRHASGYDEDSGYSTSVEDADEDPWSSDDSDDSEDSDSAEDTEDSDEDTGSDIDSDDTLGGESRDNSGSYGLYGDDSNDDSYSYRSRTDDSSDSDGYSSSDVFRDDNEARETDSWRSSEDGLSDDNDDSE